MFDITPFKREPAERYGRSLAGRSLFDFPDWMFGSRSWPGPFEVDVKELDSCYVVEADLPGMRKEDIQVEFENQFLHISARRLKKKQDEEETQGNYLHQERFSGQMSRSFFFDHINREGITAGFTDGVLKVTLPKDLQTSTSKRSIPINTTTH